MVEQGSVVVSMNLLKDCAQDILVAEVAKTKAKTPQQIILRWALQRGLPVLMGSTNVEHVRSNAEVWDFEPVWFCFCRCEIRSGVLRQIKASTDIADRTAFSHSRLDDWEMGLLESIRYLYKFDPQSAGLEEPSADLFGLAGTHKVVRG